MTNITCEELFQPIVLRSCCKLKMFGDIYAQNAIRAFPEYREGVHWSLSGLCCIDTKAKNAFLCSTSCCYMSVSGIVFTVYMQYMYLLYRACSECHFAGNLAINSLEKSFGLSECVVVWSQTYWLNILVFRVKLYLVSINVISSQFFSIQTFCARIPTMPHKNRYATSKFVKLVLTSRNYRSN